MNARTLTHWLASAAALALMSAPALAKESRSYAVGYFYAASYSEDGDCPTGYNPTTAEGWIAGMRALGLSEEKIKAYFEGSASMKQGERQEISKYFISQRGRIGEKAVNVYANPLARPYLKDEPQFKTTVSKYAFGFNLDGKGAASTANTFEDPESHEKGVNNEYHRVMSCMQSYRAKPPFRASANAMLAGSTYAWITARPMMPAWLMTITGEDLSKDGPVTVTFERSLDRVNIDNRNEPLSNDTFRLDPDQKANTFKGEIKGGVITAALDNFYMKQDQLLYPEFRLRGAKLRITTKPDGGLDAVIGGYQPWMDIYWTLANPGQGNEVGNGMDTATFYIMMKKHADASPDPKTGQNSEISTAYRIEAVPAFVVPDGE